MLFNLTSCNQFPSKKTGKDIVCSNGFGPCFRGGDWSELSAYEEPFNEDENCRSHANKSGFGISVDGEGRNLLTN